MEIIKQYSFQNKYKMMRIFITILFLFIIFSCKDGKIISVNERIVDKILKQEKDTLINITVAPLDRNSFKHMGYYNEMKNYNLKGYFTNTSNIIFQKNDTINYPHCKTKLDMYYLNDAKDKAIILTERYCSQDNIHIEKENTKALFSNFSASKKCYFVRKIWGFWFIEKIVENETVS